MKSGGSGGHTHIAAILIMAVLGITIGAALMAVPVAADPPWMAVGNYFTYNVEITPRDPPGPADSFDYNVTITTVTMDSISFREEYTKPNETITINTTFSKITRYASEPAGLGWYYSWFWVLPSEVMAQSAPFTNQNFTLLTSASEHTFRSAQPNGNYTLLNFTASDQHLASGNGTIMWNGTSSLFRLVPTGSGSSGGSGGLTGGMPRVWNTADAYRRTTKLGPPAVRPMSHIIVYDFRPPYNNGGGWGDRYNAMGWCWLAQFDRNGPDVGTGTMHAKSDAYAQAGGWACGYVTRIWSYSYDWMRGPQAGSWTPTTTETLFTEFRYFMDVTGLVFISIPWWGGAAAGRATVTLTSTIYEVGTGWIVNSDSWTVFDFRGYAYTDWAGPVGRTFSSNVVAGRTLYHYSYLHSDTRAAAIGYGAATAVADVWAVLQFVQLRR